jgi:hypothetical protein
VSVDGDGDGDVAGNEPGPCPTGSCSRSSTVPHRQQPSTRFGHAAVAVAVWVNDRVNVYVDVNVNGPRTIR